MPKYFLDQNCAKKWACKFVLRCKKFDETKPLEHHFVIVLDISRNTSDVSKPKLYEESELAKLKDALEGLRQTQAYLGLVDMLDWVLTMTHDCGNTFEATQQFIEYLVVDNMYTENYLATSANQPGSPYRAMAGHEEM